MKKFLGLLFSSIIFLFITLYFLSDRSLLLQIKPQMRFAWLLVTPIIALCATTLTKVQSLLNTNEIASRELERIKPISAKIRSKLWTLLAFYIVSSTCIFSITFFPIKSDFVLIVSVSMGFSLIFICLYTFTSIHSINEMIVRFNERIRQRELKKQELEDINSRLEQDASYSEEDRSFLAKQNRIVSFEEHK